MKISKIKHIFPALALMLTGVLLSFNVNAQSKSPSEHSIKFTSQNYQQALATAKAEHKQLFVDAFATWCAPCKALKLTTFRNAKTAAFFNAHFINFSIDVEKGEGIDLAKTWQIEGLPTLLIIDESGKVLANHTGYVDGKGLIEFSKEASGN
jgi:thiol:disulfide interchange protein